MDGKTGVPPVETVEVGGPSVHPPTQVGGQVAVAQGPTPPAMGMGYDIDSDDDSPDAIDWHAIGGDLTPEEVRLLEGIYAKPRVKNALAAVCLQDTQAAHQQKEQQWKQDKVEEIFI